MSWKNGDEYDPVKRKSNFLTKKFYTFQIQKAQRKKLCEGWIVGKGWKGKNKE